MNPLIHGPRAAIRLGLLVVASAAVLGVPSAAAVSSTSSAASDSVASSVGSTSDSVRDSSRSSRPGPRLAAGEFRVVEVMAAAREDRLQLRLLPADANNAEGFILELPRLTVERASIGVGERIAARPRSWGIEFALATTQQAFFLVLDDELHRELAARPVLL